jgi:hypothetical protein
MMFLLANIAAPPTVTGAVDMVMQAGRVVIAASKATLIRWFFMGVLN